MWRLAYRAGGQLELAIAIICLEAPQPGYAMV